MSDVLKAFGQLRTTAALLAVSAVLFIGSAAIAYNAVAPSGPVVVPEVFGPGEVVPAPGPSTPD